MTSWLTSLSALAGKASDPLADWFSPHASKLAVTPVDAEFIAACSPERVRALCELAEAARYYTNEVQKDWPNKGSQAWDSLLAALASLEPARKEET